MNKKNDTEIPLYIDLDGTLIKTDLLFESFIEFIPYSGTFFLKSTICKG